MAATVTGAFVVLDRASRPIRRIRDSARDADKWVRRLGDDLDRIGTQEQVQMMGRTAQQIRRLGGEAHEASDDTEVLRERLDRVGAPQVARNIATNADAIRQTGRAADRADPPLRRMAGRTRDVDRAARGAGSSLSRFGSNVFGLRQALMLSLIPALGLAAQGIGALGAGVVELLPKLTDLTGLAAPAATSITGLGLAMVTVKLATADLSKALSGNKNALKGLTPEAKAFVTTLREYQPVMKDLRRSAQQGLFPGLDLALRRLNRGVPVAQSLLENMGRTLGSLASTAAGRLTGAGFLRDFELLGTEGTRIVDRMGRGVLNLVDAFRDFLVVGTPFTRWLTDTVYGWTENIRLMARAGRESGRLANWFMRVQESLETLGRIAGNVWGAIGGTLRAARSEGDLLYDSIEKVTARWDEWANSAQGQRDMREYFRDMRAPLREVVGFVGDLGRSLGQLSRGEGFVESMRALRAAMPALTEGLDQMASGFGPELFRAVGALAETFGNLASHSGPLTLVLRLLGNVLSTVNQVVETVPALGTVLAAALSVMAIRRFSGWVGNLAREWLGVAGAARTAAAAQQQAMTPGRGVGPVGGRGGTTGKGTPSATTASPWVLTDPRQRGNPGGRAPMSGPGRLARAGGALGTAGRFAGTGLRAAGRFALPVSGAMAAFDFLGTPGAADERALAAISGASLGFIDRPLLGAEAVQQGRDRAARLEGRSSGTIRDRQAKLRGQLGARNATDNSAGNWGGFRPEWAGGAGMAGGLELTGNKRRRVQEELKRLNAQLPVQVKIEHEDAVRKSRTAASALAIGFGEAFNVYNRRWGIQKAMRQTTDDVVERMKSMGPHGRRALSQNMLTWAREQARQNPKLWNQVHRMENEIVETYRRMGRKVLVVNGEILDGSRSQWGKIQEALSTPAERARQRVSRAFTAIQREAAAALTLMGFSQRDANTLIRGQTEGGRRTQQRASNITNAGNPAAAGAAPFGRTGQTGTGRVRQGLTGDGWGIGDGIGNQGRGAVAATSARANTKGSTGNLMGANAGLGVYAQDAAGFGLHVSSGLRPGSITSAGNASYHGSGNALDLAGSPAAMMAFAKHAATAYGSRLEELIHTPMGFSIKNGQRVAPYAQADHYDHVHIADTQPGGLGGGGGIGIGGGGAAGGAMGQVKLRRVGETGGAADMLAGRSHNLMAAALESRINDAIGGGSLGAGGGATSAGGQYSKSALAQLWMQAGGDPARAQLMAAIALAESGGNPNAHNPSGATGLWQILGNPFPGNARDPLTNARMAVAKLNSQGLGAWEAYTRGMHQRFMGDGWGMDAAGAANVGWGGWFKNGGKARAKRPTLIGIGDTPGVDEQVTVEHVRSHAGGGKGGAQVSLHFAPGAIVVHGGTEESAQQIVDMVATRLAALIESMGLESESGVSS